jgi:uncharacterized protein (DUF169 family)
LDELAGDLNPRSRNVEVKWFSDPAEAERDFREHQQSMDPEERVQEVIGATR